MRKTNILGESRGQQSASEDDAAADGGLERLRWIVTEFERQNRKDRERAVLK